MERAMLLGSDYTELGSIGADGIDPHIGLAISRGRFPKGYRHVDPNEDAAFAASMGAVSLLVVADGHNGFDAAAVSINAVAGSVEDIVRRALGDPQAAAAYAMELVATEVTALTSQSGVAISVAIVHGSGGVVATVGDTTAIVVEPRGAQRLGDSTDFLRSGADPPVPSFASIRLGPADAVVLATDGVIDFAGRDPLRSVARAVAGLGAEPAARSLIDIGFAGGAGDNLAAAVLVPATAVSP